MRKSLTLSLPVLTCLLASTGAFAADQTTITIKTNGLNCSTSAGSGTFVGTAWGFGATNNTSVTSTGGAAAKAQIGNVNVTKQFDACSAALFGSVMSGNHLQDLTLTQSVGNLVVMTVKLSTVFVTSYQVGGSDSGGGPTESVSFSFQIIQITDAASHTTAGWNVSANKAQ